MRNSIKWPNGGANAAPEEAGTLAEWRLYLNDQNVCLHLDGADGAEQLVLPLYALANGLAGEWWRLFGGRDISIDLIDHRMGYAVPDIRMQFDGRSLEVSAHQKTYRNPDVRFWAGDKETLDRRDAELVLAEFVDRVVQRLAGGGIEGSSLGLRWARVSRSRGDADESAFCEAAGALGLDPYAIDERSAALIETAAGMFQGEP